MVEVQPCTKRNNRGRRFFGNVNGDWLCEKWIFPFSLCFTIFLKLKKKAYASFGMHK